jgi:hypothetical protein
MRFCSLLITATICATSADARSGESPGEDAAEAAKLAGPPVIESQRDAERLRNLEGITLQWIGWDERGSVRTAIDADGVWRLNGQQFGENRQMLEIDGTITRIGADFFELTGAVTILDTPDEGRSCEGYGAWRFAVTQNRQYYRLREFEWCDGLTDYIDLYFSR